MRVACANISSVVQNTCNQLQLLKSKIEDDIGNVNEEEIVSVISLLQKGSNQLAREINQSTQIAPLDAKLKTSLFKLIQALEHSSTLLQALGHHQVELMNAIKKIEVSMRKAEQKVSKVDKEPL